MLISVAPLALVAAPATAHAALTWSGPPCEPLAGHCQELSPGGTGSSDMHVATDAAGDAVAVWLQSDPTTNVVTVEEARRPAGGNFGAEMAISAAQVNNQDSDAKDPSVSMNAHGDVIVVWDQFDSGLYSGVGAQELFYSWEPAGRPWAPIQVVRQGAVGGDTNPQVGLDSAGDAILVWLTASNDSNFRTLAAAYRPAGDNSQFGTIDRLTECPICTNPPDRPSYPSAPQLTVNAAGDGLVTFVDTYNPQDIDADDRVDAVFLPAGGDVVHWPQFGQQTTLSTGTATGFLVHDPSPALDSAGDGLVVFGQGEGRSDIEAAYRPKSLGAWSAAQTISTTQFNDLPQAAFDPSGGAFAVWGQEPGTPGSPAQVVAAYRPAGTNTAFGTAVQLSASTVQSDYPQIGVDGQGRPAAVWVSTDSSGDDTVEASSRPPGPGPWAAPSSLSSAGDLDAANSGEPKLSVSAAGQAVAVWQRSDGTELIAQAAIGTPPESKPPPPPPPPPPPVPEAITPAAPFERGKAIVLTVKVQGDATRLEWDVSGPNPKIEAGIVDGHLQRSIRLRPDTRNFTARVTAFGPGGSRTYTRSFLLPKPLSDPTSTAAQHAVDDLNAPPVFAVGDAQDLLGTGGDAADAGARAADTGCGKITVYSAAQTLSGCMRPVNVLGNIPAGERGFIAPLADHLGIDPSNLPLVQDAVEQMDGYVAQGTALVNDNWPVVPDGAAQLVSFAQASQLTSSSASIEVGGLKFGASKNGFSMDLNPRLSDIPLGDLPRPPKLPSIAGFELTGDWHIDLQKRVATITASLKLPDFITAAGVSIQNSVTLRATPDRLILQDIKIGPLSVDIGSLGVDDFALDYDDATNEWVGQGKACVLPGACLDMVPPNGEIKIKDGGLEFAGASLDFPLPGLPLFTGINLERIGFGFGLDPTRMTGNGRIAVVRLVKVDGRMVIAFPSDRTPFVLKPDEVGDGFPARLYGTAFTRTTIGATAAVSVEIPDILNFELGHGYFLYQYPSYIAVGGGLDTTLFDLIRLYGDVSGEANFSDKTINLHGDAHACLLIGGQICAGAVINISHGPGNIGGAGGCLDLGPVSVGAGVQWNRLTDPFIWPFDGCKWSRFAIHVNTSAAAAAAGQLTMRVRPGKPDPALKIYGQGAAPMVHVSGPGGQFDSTARGIDISPDHRIRIIRYHGAAESFTVIGLQHERPGTYVITPLPGSVAFGQAERAVNPPNALATGRVTGRDLHRALAYRVRPRADQSVTFWEVGEGQSAKAIGTVRGGGQGVIRFSPAPGRARRTIVAQFTLAGLPAERLRVASFRPPSPTLPRPRALRVIRHKRALVISWHPVHDAVSYQISVTSPTGLQRFATTRHHTFVLKRIPLSAGGTVTVRAVDQTRHSATTSSRFKALAAPPRAFHALGHCKLSRHKITCHGYTRRFKHHHHRKPKRRKH